ncbi:6-phosphogluconate dehydrogenase C-terminal domain-like protein [Byssothecium circinans]|uniref:6-phosphogluconate dehydrogenase C-terminal domain-like protein n=1 Tax=Byssothecium circinans TaxID=147558 RepID=A0A6A5TJC9_9PLEO|nr:6-phosphogluconate dehydrogenase C-terminal domain-like protein [Byssothecium circinans]
MLPYTQTRVSILGAGPAGLALALNLQTRGIQVLVYSHPAHLRHVNAIQEKGHITASGLWQGYTKLDFCTDMATAVAFSHLLILTVPSTGQETLLEELKNFALDRHTIIAVPGNLFALVAADLDVGCIVETNLSPYSCRMNGSNVRILGQKDQIFVAASKRGLSPAFYDMIESVLPVELCWCSSVVEVCLLNINGVFHPLMMLLNAGRIESTGGDFFIYRDGLTPAVANAMVAVDRVRVQIGKALGLELKSALEVSNDCYGHDFTSLVDLGRRSSPHNNLQAPDSLEHRNISEDVPDLLACWLSLAEKLGIDAEPIRAVIVLVKMATGIDYLKEGRNLQKLRLENVSKEELIRRFRAEKKAVRATMPVDSYSLPGRMIMSRL